MSFKATVIRVMIASPSDVPEARDAVERAIHGWNDANAIAKQVVLLPWRWETASIPVMGGHPQKLINGQGVVNSDIVFAMFGGRLGTPTGDAASGTAEEIDKALAIGKSVHLYFSTGPLPTDVDTAQLDALRAFKEDMRMRGLLGEFNNPEQQSHEVWKAIEHDLGMLDLTGAPQSSSFSGVRLLAQPGVEREVNGFDSKGKPRYRSRRWVDISNRGDVDAIEVTFKPAMEDSGMFLMTSGKPTVIHAGQTRRFPIELALGSGPEPVLRVSWVEQGETKEQDFHVG